MNLLLTDEEIKRVVRLTREQWMICKKRAREEGLPLEVYGLLVSWEQKTQESRNIAQAQLRRVTEWLDDWCETIDHYPMSRGGGYRVRRWDCPDCRQELRKAAGME